MTAENQSINYWHFNGNAAAAAADRLWLFPEIYVTVTGDQLSQPSDDYGDVEDMSSTTTTMTNKPPIDWCNTNDNKLFDLTDDEHQHQQQQQQQLLDNKQYKRQYLPSKPLSSSPSSSTSTVDELVFHSRGHQLVNKLTTDLRKNCRISPYSVRKPVSSQQTAGWTPSSPPQQQTGYSYLRHSSHDKNHYHRRKQSPKSSTSTSHTEVVSPIKAATVKLIDNNTISPAIHYLLYLYRNGQNYTVGTVVGNIEGSAICTRILDLLPDAGGGGGSGANRATLRAELFNRNDDRMVADMSTVINGKHRITLKPINGAKIYIYGPDCDGIVLSADNAAGVETRVQLKARPFKVNSNDDVSGGGVSIVAIGFNVINEEILASRHQDGYHFVVADDDDDNGEDRLISFKP